MNFDLLKEQINEFEKLKKNPLELFKGNPVLEKMGSGSIKDTLKDPLSFLSMMGKGNLGVDPALLSLLQGGKGDFSSVLSGSGGDIGDILAKVMNMQKMGNMGNNNQPQVKKGVGLKPILSFAHSDVVYVLTLLLSC